MPNVLIVDESWFTYTVLQVHQKGFDAFPTAECTEGGGIFPDALRSRGHGVTRVPSHEIPTRVPVVRGLERSWPALLGLNEVTARPEASLPAECAGHPLLVVGGHGAGRSAAFTSDVAPHWAPPPFLAWEGYAELWDRLVRWLAGSEL